MLEFIHGDCLKVLDTFEDGTFDAVVTDPPYASGGATLSAMSKSTAKKYIRTKKKCFYPGFAGDSMDQKSWTRFMHAVFEGCYRVSKEGAVLVCFIDWKEFPVLTDAIQWAGWIWNGAVVWDRQNSRPRRQQAEFVLWGSKGAFPANRLEPVLPDVYSYANTSSKERLNQTQKPLKLMRDLVRICVPSGKILDPFAGSTSTLEAAALEGYDAVGIGRTETSYSAGRQRMSV